jgi:hypothetical protein
VSAGLSTRPLASPSKLPLHGIQVSRIDALGRRATANKPHPSGIFPQSSSNVTSYPYAGIISEDQDFQSRNVGTNSDVSRRETDIIYGFPIHIDSSQKKRYVGLLLDTLIRMAWRKSTMAPLRDGVPCPLRHFNAAGLVGALDRLIRFRDVDTAGLAHNNLSSVLRCRRHLRAGSRWY